MNLRTEQGRRAEGTADVPSALSQGSSATGNQLFTNGVPIAPRVASCDEIGSNGDKQMLKTFSWTKPLRLALLGPDLVTFGFAQMNGMGGGMMGSGSSGSGMSGTSTGMSGGMGSGMQGGMSGMAGGMGSMAAGPVVGTDGTAYVLRETTVTSGSQQTTKREL